MARPQQRPEPDIIDLTEEPDSPVLHTQHVLPPFRTAARSAARSATRPAGVARTAPAVARPTPTPNVIDLTGDADDDLLSGAGNNRWMDSGSRQRQHQVQDMNHMQQLLQERERVRQRQEFLQHQHQHQGAQGNFFESLHRIQHSIADLSESLGEDGSGAGGSGARGPATSFFGSFGGLSSFNISGVAHLASMAFGPPAPHRRVRSIHRQGRSHARAQNRPIRAEAVRGAGGERALFEEFLGSGNPLLDNLPDLNYQFNGGMFNGHHDGAPLGGPRRAPYPAPGDAPEGYTRSTGEDMVAVCAGCDTELAYDPDEPQTHGSVLGEPPKKKTRSRKDREEHYFWAVTSCGHVYCKSCYENRRNCLKKDGSGASGSTKMAAPPVVFVADGKTILCAVDDCQSDVTAKKAWVGLFV